MPLTGDASDRARVLAVAPLLAAVRQLAERSVFGLVWAGPDLVVESIYGPIASFVAIGEPLTDSIYALVGMENEISALRARPGSEIELPDVTIVTAGGRRPRATLSVTWSAEASAFLILISRTQSQSDLEIELTAQMRARLIAESALAAKTRELEQLNVDLARANDDLESYASVISHDLQSPMRVLRYTLDDLEGAIASVTADVPHEIAKLRDLSLRMTAMLSALLDYATVTRKSDAVEGVDTAALVQAIAASIDAPKGLRIDIQGTWPHVQTLAAPLDLVLRNLIDNAVKHHDRAAGTVIVSATPEPGHIVIGIADDGPGILPELREVAFMPFRRLRSGDGSAGQGMGLALVRRTVESIGGRLTLESGAPAARGTTFTIRWPMSETHNSEC